MTEIYLVRHCEAIGNIKKLFQGTSDFDITDLGAKQLEKLQEKFNDVSLDKVYSSPLSRTRKTAQAIIGNKDLELNIEDGLIEICGGIIEGKPFAESFEKIPDLKETWFNHPEDFDIPEGESMRNAYDRIYNTIIKLADENKGKTIACATHGGVIRCLQCRIVYNDITYLSEVALVGNTGISLITVDDNHNIEIKYSNDISHLTE